MKDKLKESWNFIIYLLNSYIFALLIIVVLLKFNLSSLILKIFNKIVWLLDSWVFLIFVI